MKTKAILNEPHNGHKMFRVYEVDDLGEKAVEFDKKTGEKKIKKAIISIGMKKTEAILNHSDLLNEFVNGK